LERRRSSVVQSAIRCRAQVWSSGWSVFSIVICRVPGQDLGQSVDLLDRAVDLTVLRAADRNVRQCPRGEMARRAQGISPCVGSWEQAIAGTPPRTPHPASVTHPSSSVTRPFPRMQAKDSRRGDASVPASHTPRIPTQSLPPSEKRPAFRHGGQGLGRSLGLGWFEPPGR
jgi:hypothetical protein